MSKSKKIIFFIIVIMSIIIIFHDRVPRLFKKSNIKVKEMTLSEGGYVVNKDIAEGYYDIEVIEGDISFNKRLMSKGSKIISEQFMNKNFILVEGTGKIKIVPAKFDKLILVNGLYKISNSGNYKVGGCIKSGKYKLTYNCNDTEYENKKPLIQILSAKDNSIVNSYNFEETNSYNISLNESEILQVNKGLFEDYKNYYILLEVIE